MYIKMLIVSTRSYRPLATLLTRGMISRGNESKLNGEIFSVVNFGILDYCPGRAYRSWVGDIPDILGYLWWFHGDP